MATIITINSGDLMETTTRNNLNTNFANLNAELATMLPKSGGTMTGNIAMGSNRITGLPAPSANDEPARKVDFDSAVLLTGNQTVAGVKTFSSSPVVPAATWGRADIKAGRRVFYIHGTVKQTTSRFQVGDLVPASSSVGLPAIEAGCITGISTCDAAGNIYRQTRPYQSSGLASDGRFAIDDKLGVFRNTTTGIILPTVNGTNVSTSWTATGTAPGGTDDLQVTIRVELDD